MCPCVRPANVSIAFGSESGLIGVHPCGLADVNPPLWAFRRAFMWMYCCCRSVAACFHCSYVTSRSISRIHWYKPVGSPSVKASIVWGTSNWYPARRVSSSNSTMYASMSSPFIFIPALSMDRVFSCARLSTNHQVNEAATSFHSLSSS